MSRKNSGWRQTGIGPTAISTKASSSLPGRSCICRRNGCDRPLRCSSWRAPTSTNIRPRTSKFDLTVVLRLIETWLAWLEGRDFDHNPLRLHPPPVWGSMQTAG